MIPSLYESWHHQERLIPNIAIRYKDSSHIFSASKFSPSLRLLWFFFSKEAPIDILSIRIHRPPLHRSQKVSLADKRQAEKATHYASFKRGNFSRIYFGYVCIKDEWSSTGRLWGGSYVGFVPETAGMRHHATCRWNLFDHLPINHGAQTLSSHSVISCLKLKSDANFYPCHGPDFSVRWPSVQRPLWRYRRAVAVSSVRIGGSGKS